jgi:hypothetical protein
MQPPPPQPPEGFGATMMAPAPNVPPARPAAPAAGVVPTPFQQAPVAPAGPVVPSAPTMAAAAPEGGAGGKGKSAAAPPPAQQGQKKGAFRETMWFKKGELDEAAAQAAAAAPQSPDALPVSDKADELPIEDRYKDDGSISARDREKFSLRTGATSQMPVVKVPEGSVGAKMDERDMVKEMGGNRGKFIALIVVVLLAAGGVVAWQVLGNKKHSEPPATTPATAPAAPR